MEKESHHSGIDKAKKQTDILAEINMAMVKMKKENIAMRIKNAEDKMNGFKAEALKKHKDKDKEGAVAALRKAKMYEKELTGLDG